MTIYLPKMEQNQNFSGDFEHGWRVCDLIFYPKLPDTPAESFSAIMYPFSMTFQFFTFIFNT